MSSGCPFAKSASVNGTCPVKSTERSTCPMKSTESTKKKQEEHDDDATEKSNNPGIISPKCPFGYDAQTFKLGPLSCMLCKSLLYESSKCVPCSHKFCKVCVSRFKDCPLCGADIEKIEPDTDLQATVDQFIDGHCRIRRSQDNVDKNETGSVTKNVIYADVSMERGAFLIQQAMRAFNGKNIESAKSRFELCAEDIREQLEESGNTSELCTQLGTVLGMLGDCCRIMGDTTSAVAHYEESAECLSKLPANDLEIVHTLSVSLNKIGDLKYYAGDLQSARNYYVKSLDVRRQAVQENSLPSQVLDLSVSLAKVADIDRNLGSEDVAIDGFREAISCLESLNLSSEETALEQRRSSVLQFLNSQLAEKQPVASISSV